MGTGSGRLVPLLALGLGVLAYSHDAVCSRLAAADPALVAAGRFAVAAGLLWPVVLLKGKAALRRLDRRSLSLTCLAGLLLAIDFTAWIAASQMTAVANSLILAHMTPVWTILLAACWLRRRPRRLEVWIVVLSVVGAGVVARGTAFAAAGGNLVGDLLAIASSLPSAIFLVLTATLAGRVPALLYTTLAWTVAACLLLGLCLLRGLPVPVEPQVIAGILGMGVLVQGLGHGLITWAVCRFSPLFVATCCLGDPVLGSLWGLVYFEEQLGPLVLLGGCLIGAAILLGSRAELHGKSAGPAPATAPHHT